MPLSEYFKGRGRQVMESMQDRYGDAKGKSIFYSTANKQNQTPDDPDEPEDASGEREDQVASAEKEYHPRIVRHLGRGR